MEALFISYKYPPSIGGMQKQSYHLIEGYGSLYQTHSITYNQKGSLLFFFISLFWRVPFLLIKHPTIKLVHLNDGVCGICCLWIKLFTNKKVIITYHGLDLVFPNLLYQKVLLPLAHHVDGVIAVSDYTAEQCILRGFPKSKVHVVKNGVDTTNNFNCTTNISTEIIETNRRASLQNKNQIVAIGRPVKRKGFVWFVKNVLPSLPMDTQFILIGPYPNYSQWMTTTLKLLPQRISRQIELCLGLSTKHIELKKLCDGDKFIWYQDLNHIDKNYMLSEADLLVMPNISVDGDMEGFGLVALEANMYDVPVIASGIEGITSAVTNGRNGWLANAEDADAWIDMIGDYLLHRPVLACRQYAIENYSWNKMVSEYERVFSEIVSLSESQNVAPAH